MRLRGALAAVAIMVVTGALIFSFFQRQLLSRSFGIPADRELLTQLQDSLEDQKRLAQLEPELEATYRERFARLERSVGRLRILEHSRGRLAQRYELVLLAIFAVSVLAVTAVYAWRQARHAPRLDRIRAALVDLVDGRTDITLGDRGRDPIGRIATMIERTSRTMARDRRRLARLRNLSSWQEAARRQAHEMRTPLAAARLELDRLKTLSERGEPARADWLGAVDGVAEELEQLGDFTSRFAGFGKLREPALEACDLAEFVRRFTDSFATAWPNLELGLELAPDRPVAAPVAIDREMMRQVLVNLCDNSSLALGERRGRTCFRLATGKGLVTLEVADDGPGVDPALQEQLFQPYATTRRVGDGMGLGLAISQKILLDHGGDLELAASSARGATFRLTLPKLEQPT